MGLYRDLYNKVSQFEKDRFKIENTSIIPDASHNSLTYGNTGLLGKYTFLFTDIRRSSELFGLYGMEKSAKVYQSFHEIVVAIIRENGGEIRSFDGDRVMGVFNGSSPNSDSVKTGMQIRWAISNVLNKILNTKISCGIGIDNGDVLIIKVGKGRNINNNDLVWVGQPVNYASHLCNQADNSILISPEVYEKLRDDAKFSQGVNMWKLKDIIIKSGKTIESYESTYHWSID